MACPGELPPKYFDIEAYAEKVITEGMRSCSRGLDGKMPGYTYTFREYKKMLLESPLEIEPSGGVRVTDMGCSIRNSDVARFSTHGPWDHPSFTPAIRSLAYKVHLVTFSLQMN